MENNNQVLKVSDIKNLIRHLSDELNKLDDADGVELHDDLYWNILDNELYNPYHEPAKLTIGSLTEDWEFLQKFRSGGREMIDYDLYKLASILKFLGKNNIMKKK
ncbi:hypothetical protein [Chryseobacterium sp. Marseille-Q3244]|uniref:hypothetical protein n=1 Tax=Chryseobacterium sp. Marseille-Q3244 TaxID=2758092 RepID=UPI002023F8B6|nr:hypothetical protein [Chryseobacterium sp. Marseille-Q3244]